MVMVLFRIRPEIWKLGLITCLERYNVLLLRSLLQSLHGTR